MKREEYTREEHLYLIRKQMGVSTGKFNMMEVRFNVKLKRKVVLLLLFGEGATYQFIPCTEVNL